MAVKWVREVASGRTGNRSNSLDRSYVRIFSVETDSLLDGLEVVINATVDNGFVLPGALPKLYDPYTPMSGTNDLGSWCQNIRGEPEANSYLWKVVCEYSTKLDRPDIQNQLRPDLRPAEIEWDTISINIPAIYDSSGQAILNSAGDPFDPPLEEEEMRLVLRISKNIDDDLATSTGFDAVDYGAYQNTVNASPWLDFKARQVKCRKIKATRFFEDATYYWRLVGEFEIGFRDPPTNTVWPNPPGWLLLGGDPSYTWVKYVLDRGFREIAQVPLSVAGQKIPIRDPLTKQPLSFPGLLDGTGKALTPGATPVFLAFDKLEAMDFSLLGLP